MGSREVEVFCTESSVCRSRQRETHMQPHPVGSERPFDGYCDTTLAALTLPSLMLLMHRVVDPAFLVSQE